MKSESFWKFYQFVSVFWVLYGEWTASKWKGNIFELDIKSMLNKIRLYDWNDFPISKCDGIPEREREKVCVCTACVISSPRFESFGRVCVCEWVLYMFGGKESRFWWNKNGAFICYFYYPFDFDVSLYMCRRRKFSIDSIALYNTYLYMYMI